MRPLANYYAIAGARAAHGEPISKTDHVWCLSELDPLTLVPYLDTTHVGHNVTKDPMLKEFVASLTLNRTVRGPTPRS